MEPFKFFDNIKTGSKKKNEGGSERQRERMKKL